MRVSGAPVSNVDVDLPSKYHLKLRVIKASLIGSWALVADTKTAEPAIAAITTNIRHAMADNC